MELAREFEERDAAIDGHGRRGGCHVVVQAKDSSAVYNDSEFCNVD
jgi:hypothetical protein